MLREGAGVFILIFQRYGVKYILNGGVKTKSTFIGLEIYSVYLEKQELRP